ncbi:helix-turn-helix domain-containing protein [Streptacidiphilus sp. N1-12]|uniref:Helix-turn-helix domain-containing protein n=1 Tax=Streptacidiphilus alkalitolerans TaxID=3342712 RepID=A0ABV6WRL8_9ACTN
MATEENLFNAVDALLQGEEPVLPLPEERVRLREAAGVTQARLAQVLESTTQSVKNWEAARSEPRPPRLQAYKRLLDGWAARYPAPQSLVPDAVAAPAVPSTFAPAAPAPAPEPEVSAAPAPAHTAPTTATAATAPRAAAAARGTSRKPGAAKAAPVADDRFPHGPLAVLDGDGLAYAAGGLVLECEATTIAQLVDWTLNKSGLGAPRLHRNGRDGDPLIVLTAAACERFGLPLSLLDDEETMRSMRLPEDHRVVKALTRAKWKLTRRGFGPWARVYRPAVGSARHCVQFAVLPWNALEERAFGDAAALPAPDLARVLSVYATRVITPRGSTAVTGLELMTALRPPTRAVKEGGVWVSAPNPGALHEAVDAAPPEVPKEHPLARDWTGGFLDEEAYQWVRPMELLGDVETMLPWAVGLDINTAFLAAASRLSVGLSAPVHLDHPEFDKKLPGSWLVDLSHIELDPRLPSPFTPSGQRPTGPAWYATPTVAYAVELGGAVHPIEAFVRTESGPYLDPWHDRLKDAYVSLMAEAGIPVDKDTDEKRFLAAMAAHGVFKTKDKDLAKVALGDGGPGEFAALRQLLREAGVGELADLPDEQLAAAQLRHRQIAMVLGAVKSTVKGGIGKLRERNRSKDIADGERWPALERPTWRPDIRAAVIAKARVNMHRKMARTALETGRFPLAVLSDCVVYASADPSPLGFLPLTGAGKVLPGSFRLGATPGLAKVEGVNTMLWAVGLMEDNLNPARHIKGGDAVTDEGE